MHACVNKSSDHDKSSGMLQLLITCVHTYPQSEISWFINSFFFFGHRSIVVNACIKMLEFGGDNSGRNLSMRRNMNIRII